MRKRIVLAILLVSLTLFSYKVKEKSEASLHLKKRTNLICGPSFDSLYNHHSTAFVSAVNGSDPLLNSFSFGSAEPGDVYSISGMGSQSGYAGGTYHIFVILSNPPTGGSITIYDQFNNVIECENIISTRSNYHMVINAACATTYRIVLSDSSC
jgi:hypothetical protein